MCCRCRYAKLTLTGKDTATGKTITDFKRVTQIWVEGEPLVRNYASPEAAFAELGKLEKAGKKVRVVYAHDRNNGLKLFAADAWFVNAKNEVSAFLLKDAADAWAKQHGGKVMDYNAVKAGASS